MPSGKYFRLYGHTWSLFGTLHVYVCVSMCVGALQSFTKVKLILGSCVVYNPLSSDILIAIRIQYKVIAMACGKDFCK
jgi:hypothetical protein